MKAMIRWLVAALALVALAAPARAQEEEPRRPPDGKSDGVKVHGHWTVEVRNPDGSLVSHNEFENALVPSGAAVLSRVIGLVETVARWGIDAAVTNVGGVGGTLNIREPALTVSVPVSGPNAGSVVLQGSATSPHSGMLTNVETQIGTSSAPGTMSFTYRQIQGITVAAGQIVQFTVVFSFS